jgi:Rrf2 family nitric oxide-sensitive transcriptional repressor
MQLTRFTDLSLRVLMHLAWQPDGITSNIATMAKLYSVPENHLVKVVHHLGKIGLIQTTRGRGGGIRLARPRTEIRIGQVVRLTESTLELVDCDGPQPCPLRGGCGLKGVLDGARDAFLAKLDETSLADVTRGDSAPRVLQSLPVLNPV